MYDILQKCSVSQIFGPVLQTFSGQICVRNADDLETWLELALAVHAWISRLLRKDPGDTQALDTFWTDGREATEPPLSTELIIAGRDEAARHIAHHLQGLPGVLTNESSVIPYRML
jgi:hypothetical protein